MSVLYTPEEAAAQACALVRRAAELSGAFPAEACDCFCGDNPLAGTFGSFRHDTAGLDLISRLLDDYEAAGCTPTPPATREEASE